MESNNQLKDTPGAMPTPDPDNQFKNPYFTK